ncbi:hypothetical protein H6P81_012680 [Aristolochia fimbriata]|uniref:Fe-S metabolism associated domain-containing protein n=1 Tax=Aristolochia fimbriata TaxID=158543 RepID=A0AAV7EFS0_ARIFI|nr:hypothetical protein H6P81_012680 [Aristolochia fimbriata]
MAQSRAKPRKTRQKIQTHFKLKKKNEIQPPEKEREWKSINAEEIDKEGNNNKKLSHSNLEGRRLLLFLHFNRDSLILIVAAAAAVAVLLLSPRSALQLLGARGLPLHVSVVSPFVLHVSYFLLFSRVLRGIWLRNLRSFPCVEVGKSESGIGRGIGGMDCGSSSFVARRAAAAFSSSSSSSTSFLLPVSNPKERLSLPFRAQQRPRGFVSRPVKFAIPSFDEYPFRLPLRKRTSVARSAVTESPVVVTDLPRAKLQRLVEEFRSMPESIERVKRLLEYAALLPPLPDSDRVPHNRVMGCTAQVWVAAEMDPHGRMRFAADSDSEITKGFCFCLLWVLDGASPEEVLDLKTDDMADLNVGLPGRAHSRANTWHNVLISMQKRTKAIAAETEGKPPFEL